MAAKDRCLLNTGQFTLIFFNETGKLAFNTGVCLMGVAFNTDLTVKESCLQPLTTRPISRCSCKQSSCPDENILLHPLSVHNECPLG